MARKRSRLGEAIRLYCHIYEISERQIARETGMSAATVNRFMGGEDLQLSNFLTLMDWLMAEHTDRFTQRIEKAKQPPPEQGQD